MRERFAHLGLAEGFDELLCVPHLKGIETFWYQTETVRKVLKQFRGRVLLADEPWQDRRGGHGAQRVFASRHG